MAAPEPLYFHNHRSATALPHIIDMELDTLRRTGALLPYDHQEWGPPITILPLSLKEEGDTHRLLIDPRYPNLTTQNYATRYEQLHTFAELLPQTSSSPKQT